MLSNYFHSKKKSKKGFTLVEAVCSVMILAIVFAGVLNSVAFARQMVFTDNVRDKASDRAQIVADEMITICTGKNPDDPNLASVLADIESEVNSIINNADDPQYDNVGTVTLVSSLTGVDAYNPAYNPEIQVTVEPVSETMSDAAIDGIDTKDTTQAGWNITLRIYYQAIGGHDNWQATEISAFAPYTYVS